MVYKTNTRGNKETNRTSKYILLIGIRKLNRMLSQNHIMHRRYVFTRTYLKRGSERRRNNVFLGSIKSKR
jgi:hypothetical protein